MTLTFCHKILSWLLHMHIDSKKNFGPPKFCWNFSEIFRFFSSNSEKNIIFGDHFSRKILLIDYDFWQFSTHPWYMRVCGKLRKLKKMSFKGLEKWSWSFFSGCRYIEIWQSVTREGGEWLLRWGQLVEFWNGRVMVVQNIKSDNLANGDL